MEAYDEMHRLMDQAEEDVFFKQMQTFQNNNSKM